MSLYDELYGAGFPGGLTGEQWDATMAFLRADTETNLREYERLVPPELQAEAMRVCSNALTTEAYRAGTRDRDRIAQGRPPLGFQGFTGFDGFDPEEGRN